MLGETGALDAYAACHSLSHPRLRFWQAHKVLLQESKPATLTVSPYLRPGQGVEGEAVPCMLQIRLCGIRTSKSMYDQGHVVSMAIGLLACPSHVASL